MPISLFPVRVGGEQRKRDRRWRKGTKRVYFRHKHSLEELGIIRTSERLPLNTIQNIGRDRNNSSDLSSPPGGQIPFPDIEPLMGN